MTDCRIEQMREGDLQIAIDWAEKEGWEPGIHDAALFYLADKHGFFKGILNNQIIATGCAVNYDNKFAFFGLYIVKPEYREHGYGLALTQHRHAYSGDRNKGLDGVLDKANIYCRLGFKPYYENARYVLMCPIDSPLDKALVPLSGISFELIKAFDRQHFPAERDHFLKAWITQEEGLSLGFIDKGHLRGYGVVRRCRKAFKIGPLFAEEESIADSLFRGLACFTKNEKVFLDIPENNPLAISLVERYQMEKVFGTVRMYTKEKPILKDQQIYGITSFELG